MRAKLTLLAGVCAGAIAFPAFAQDADEQEEPEFPNNEIIVTAQRQAQRLQDVPLSVSAVNAEALEAQQIENTSDLQLALPNITFTKTNFTSSSFTIRGIGDLCVGVTCDSATGIHLNEAPLFGTRLFEGEFYDLEQVEVLRGPQGTLFGRNATSGVVNFRTARPNLNEFAASIEGEYGNFDSYKVKAMVNIPLNDMVAARFAGYYVNRDGFTENLFGGSRIDGRELGGFRGSIRVEPTSNTTIDFMVQYFEENDDRLRNQKQLCQFDPTGVLGCLNGNRGTDAPNSNTTLPSVLASTQSFGVQGLPQAFALGSVYGPSAFNNDSVVLDPRQVNTAFAPTYLADETIVQLQIQQALGDSFNLKVSGQYQETLVDSSQDYNLALQNRSAYAVPLNTLAAGAAGAFDGAIPGISAYLAPVANALIPNGPNGVVCTSATVPNNTGVFGGQSNCSDTPLSYDRSVQENNAWVVEGLLSSDFSGPLNFVVGGIYADTETTENSYYVNSFGLDYFTGIAGAFSAYANGLPPSFLASPFFRNHTLDYSLKSYGIFGEAYYDVTDDLTFTVGVRYNNDDKEVIARSTFADFLVPFGVTEAFDSPFAAGFDADETEPGIQSSAFNEAAFDEFTGRAVVNYNWTPDNLVYASYSRGYKSGGINPPLQAGLGVEENFAPEFVDAFEIGSKNTFGWGTLNLTGFYYKYDSLQLSRIVNRTSVNDNVSADIYGLEAEALVRPTPQITMNFSASYLNTEVTEDKFLSNPRDFGGGRADAVIIKDITNASNCAVTPGTAGNAAGANAFVNFVNNAINAGGIPGVPPGAGLQGTTAFPADGGIASTGAFSVCAALAGVAAAAGSNFDPNGINVLLSGVQTNIRGSSLPGAPEYKLAAGVQYEIYINNDVTLTPRADFTYTGESFGSIFNTEINAIDGYAQVNAQIQLAGDTWFVRVFGQNLTDEDAVTGLYVTDQSSGLFTNIFTLDPRRYGVAAGFKF